METIVLAGGCFWWAGAPRKIYLVEWARGHAHLGTQRAKSFWMQSGRHALRL